MFQSFRESVDVCNFRLIQFFEPLQWVISHVPGTWLNRERGKWEVGVLWAVEEEKTSLWEALSNLRIQFCQFKFEAEFGICHIYHSQSSTIFVRSVDKQHAYAWLKAKREFSHWSYHTTTSTLTLLVLKSESTSSHRNWYSRAKLRWRMSSDETCERKQDFIGKRSGFPHLIFMLRPSSIHPTNVPKRAS